MMLRQLILPCFRQKRMFHHVRSERVSDLMFHIVKVHEPIRINIYG